MSDQEAHQQTSASIQDDISEDLMCIACGYNLRGLSTHSNCPECGLQYRRTLHARAGMTRRELVAVVFKILAVWMAIGSIAGFAQVLGDFITSKSTPFDTSLFWVLVYVGLCISLWKMAGYLASKVVLSDGPISFTGRVAQDQLLAVGMSVLGVYYITQSVTSLAWMIADMHYGHSPYSIWVSSSWAITMFAVGGILLFGAGRIARAIRWLKNIGIANIDKQP